MEPALELSVPSEFHAHHFVQQQAHQVERLRHRAALVPGLCHIWIERAARCCRGCLGMVDSGFAAAGCCRLAGRWQHKRLRKSGSPEDGVFQEQRTGRWERQGSVQWVTGSQRRA